MKKKNIVYRFFTLIVSTDAEKFRKFRVDQSRII